jgi:CRP-like cAMP-binding protein
MADSGERTRLNCLLAALPERELAAVRAHSEEVELIQRETLYEAGEILEYAWFPHTGVVSLVTEFKAGQPVEIATVGSEGMAGLPLLLGPIRSPAAPSSRSPARARGSALTLSARFYPNAPPSSSCCGATRSH